MEHDDELLDQIIGHLRSEPVPVMPANLANNCSKQPRSWTWYAVGASVLAASLAGFLLWHSLDSSTHDRPLPDIAQQQITGIRESKVVVQAIDLTEPLVQLEMKLDSLDAEIAILRRKAELLDAQRVANELLVQN